MIIDPNKKVSTLRKVNKANSLLRRSGIGLSILLQFTASGEGQIVYYSFQPVSETGWSKVDTLSFSLPIDSTFSAIYITPEIRYTSQYPYQNISLAVEHIVEDSIVLRVDTVNYELRNDLGQHANYNWSCLFVSSSSLPQLLNTQHLGTHLVKVAHIMQTDSIKGISDIGIKVALKQTTSDESALHLSEGK